MPRSFASLLLLAATLNAVARISVIARDSLTVSQTRYALLRFKAVISPKQALPPQFAFSTTGPIPPGLIFESYPCHKPHTENCAALASSDTLYLDGVPTMPGVYRFVITARDPSGQTATQKFSVVVKSSASPGPK